MPKEDGEPAGLMGIVGQNLRIVDSIGVAIAAFASVAPKATLDYASAFPLASGGSTLWGTPVI